MKRRLLIAPAGAPLGIVGPGLCGRGRRGGPGLGRRLRRAPRADRRRLRAGAEIAGKNPADVVRASTACPSGKCDNAMLIKRPANRLGAENPANPAAYHASIKYKGRGTKCGARLAPRVSRRRSRGTATRGAVLTRLTKGTNHE